MSFIKNAVIAAAGLGSRLGMGKPKCLIEIDNMTILEHQLNLLSDIEDVRIVVGFEEKKVIDLAKSIRPDVTIVRNPAYRSTTTLQSYSLGAKYLQEEVLFMDGDILFQPESFNRFIDFCVYGKNIIGVTKAKTQKAIYVSTDKKKVINFSLTEINTYEWANLSWLSPNLLNSMEPIPVFEQLQNFLPLPYQEIVCYEVDTPEDLLYAQMHLDDFKSNAKRTKGISV